MKLDRDVRNEVKILCRNTRFSELGSYIQHGSTSVLRHSVAVAALSCRIAGRLHLRVDEKALIRGALLHDYFLYDWHKNHHVSWHGFRHPAIALKNAEQDVKLSDLERDIIHRHMFPLTPVPPLYKEGWIVCLADKLCSVRETFARKRKKKQRMLALPAPGKTKETV